TGQGAEAWLKYFKSSIANLALIPWLVISMVLITKGFYKGVDEWLKQPINALLLVLFFANNLSHSTHAIKVIFEDYIHCEKSKLILITIIEFLAVALFVAVIFAIANIYFNFSV
ncbi:MAG: succinate dehydrogenase, hydrophobic membrane anchor protein, partial [Rickettsiales bacterium]|nr:succinate dehydrogenase, hydrophobic membrane anchor protein [Rickettsiales bacterium]